MAGWSTPARLLRRHPTAAAWAALTLADTAAWTGLIPWLPNQILTLAVGGCIALTVIAARHRAQAPVRAAFLDGMLYQRQNAATDPLPRAVGDAGANVIAMTGPRRPAPRHHR